MIRIQKQNQSNQLQTDTIQLKFYDNDYQLILATEYLSFSQEQQEQNILFYDMLFMHTAYNVKVYGIGQRYITTFTLLLNCNLDEIIKIDENNYHFECSSTGPQYEQSKIVDINYDFRNLNVNGMEMFDGFKLIVRIPNQYSFEISQQALEDDILFSHLQIQDGYQITIDVYGVIDELLIHLNRPSHECVNDYNLISLQHKFTNEQQQFLLYYQQYFVHIHKLQEENKCTGKDLQYISQLPIFIQVLFNVYNKQSMIQKVVVEKLNEFIEFCSQNGFKKDGLINGNNQNALKQSSKVHNKIQTYFLKLECIYINQQSYERKIQQMQRENNWIFKTVSLNYKPIILINNISGRKEVYVHEGNTLQIQYINNFNVKTEKAIVVQYDNQIINIFDDFSVQIQFNSVLAKCHSKMKTSTITSSQQYDNKSPQLQQQSTEVQIQPIISDRLIKVDEKQLQSSINPQQAEIFSTQNNINSLNIIENNNQRNVQDIERNSQSYQEQHSEQFSIENEQIEIPQQDTIKFVNHNNEQNISTTQKLEDSAQSQASQEIKESPAEIEHSDLKSNVQIAQKTNKYAQFLLEQNQQTNSNIQPQHISSSYDLNVQQSNNVVDPVIKASPIMKLAYILEENEYENNTPVQKVLQQEQQNSLLQSSTDRNDQIIRQDNYNQQLDENTDLSQQFREAFRLQEEEEKLDEQHQQEIDQHEQLFQQQLQQEQENTQQQNQHFEQFYQQIAQQPKEDSQFIKQQEEHDEEKQEHQLEQQQNQIKQQQFQQQHQEQSQQLQQYKNTTQSPLSPKSPTYSLKQLHNQLKVPEKNDNLTQNQINKYQYFNYYKRNLQEDQPEQQQNNYNYRSVAQQNDNKNELPSNEKQPYNFPMPNNIPKNELSDQQEAINTQTTNLNNPQNFHHRQKKQTEDSTEQSNPTNSLVTQNNPIKYHNDQQNNDNISNFSPRQQNISKQTQQNQQNPAYNLQQSLSEDQKRSLQMSDLEQSKKSVYEVKSNVLVNHMPDKLPKISQKEMINYDPEFCQNMLQLNLPQLIRKEKQIEEQNKINSLEKKMRQQFNKQLYSLSGVKLQFEKMDVSLFDEQQFKNREEQERIKKQLHRVEDVIFKASRDVTNTLNKKQLQKALK